MRRSRLLANAVFAAAFALFAFVWPCAGSAQPKEKAKAEVKGLPIPEGTRVLKDIAYGTRGERNTLDLYLPKSDKPLPLIIWIHGGGWRNGSKAGGGRAVAMLDKGYAVAAINYRLSDAAPYPAQIEDCKAAVRLLRANAKKYNFNPEAIGAWGGSAGGHLVALLGTTGGISEFEGDGENKDVSSRVQAVCDFYGPSDMARFKSMDTADSFVGKLLGGVPSEKRDLAAKASPVKYATKDDAPFLIVHGDQDKLVPLEQSEFLLEALQKAGVECELLVVKDNAHGGPGFDTPEMRAKIQSFFDKHLKK